MSTSYFIFTLCLPALAVGLPFLFWDLWIYKLRRRKIPKCPKCKYNLSDKITVAQNKQERKILKKEFQTVTCSECSHEITAYKQAFGLRRNWTLSGLRVVIVLVLLWPLFRFGAYYWGRYSEEVMLASFSNPETYVDSYTTLESPYDNLLFRQNFINTAYSRSRVSALYLVPNDEDFRLIKRFKHLESLAICCEWDEDDRNPTKKINDTSNFSNVKGLWVVGFTGIEPASFNSLSRLERLGITNSDLTDFSELNPPAILHLEQDDKGCQLKAIKFTNSMDELRIINYEIADQVLNQNNQLTHLTLRKCRFNTDDILEPMKSLKILILHQSSPTNLSALPNPNLLEFLDIQETDATLDDPSQLATLNRLTFIRAKVHFGGKLPTMPNLESLELRQTAFTGTPITFKDICSQSSLQYLILEASHFDSLRGLEKLPNLNRLCIDVGEHKRVDLSPIYNCKSLEKIYLDNVADIDFQKISQLPNLEELVLPDLKMDGVMAALRNLKFDFHITLPKHYQSKIDPENLEVFHLYLRFIESENYQAWKGWW